MKLWSIGAAVVIGTVLGGQVLLACGNAEPGSGAGTAGSSSAGSASAGTTNAGGEPSTAGSSGTGGSSTGGSSTGGSGMGGDGPVTTGGEPAAAGSGAGGEPAMADAPLLPWKVGNSWTYDVNKNGTVTQKTTVVGALEAVGGSGPSAKLKAFHVVTSKGAGSNDRSESWQGADAANSERILRFRELTFDPKTGMLQDEVYCDPPKLHIDGSSEHTVKGATWVEKYTESTLTVGSPVTSHAVSETWKVVDDNETLQVPAGSFTQVVHLRKTGAASVKDYWYVRGVGKLKETGTQTEELVKYSLVP